MVQTAIAVHNPPRSKAINNGDEMSKKYQKTSTTLFLFHAMKQMKRLRSEVNEHRYYLERNVAHRTEHLIKRIELLEQCNAALCRKLTQNIKPIPASVPPAEAAARLYVLNADARRTA